MRSVTVTVHTFVVKIKCINTCKTFDMMAPDTKEAGDKC